MSTLASGLGCLSHASRHLARNPRVSVPSGDPKARKSRKNRIRGGIDGETNDLAATVRGLCRARVILGFPGFESVHFSSGRRAFVETKDGIEGTISEI